MFDLVFFILISVGITNIIQNETIFSFFRVFISKKIPKIYSFLTCPACFGFWLGILLSFLLPIHQDFIINLFGCGIISSICNKIYANSSNDFKIE